jgi:hypothetical protein
VLFFKTRQPIEPVAFVQKICQDAAVGVEQKRCRFVKRLTPITAIEKATEKGLDDVAQRVLASHFHGSDQQGKKVNFIFPKHRCGISTSERPPMAETAAQYESLIRTVASLQSEHQFATTKSLLETT